MQLMLILLKIKMSFPESSDSFLNSSTILESLNPGFPEGFLTELTNNISPDDLDQLGFHFHAPVVAPVIPAPPPAAAAAAPVVKLEGAVYPLLNQHIQHEQQQPQQQHADEHYQQEHGQQMDLPSYICNAEFAGEYEFEVFINPHHGKKSPWVYSSALNKIFICMNHKFGIDFKYKSKDDKDLYVRAIPVYTETQHSSDLVTRCINHAHGAEATNKGLPQHIWDHIIRCQHRLAVYGGSKGNARHLFVRVPLGKPPLGTESFPLNYQFMCKNSCGSESGMNRKPIEVVFTLEDGDGVVLGRRVLSVRICSCPKRDKEKEEIDYYKKIDPSAPAPQNKKRKLEKKFSSSESSYDKKEYEVRVTVVGLEDAKSMYKSAYSLLAAQMIRHNVDQPFRKLLNEADQKLHALGE